MNNILTTIANDFWGIEEKTSVSLIPMILGSIGAGSVNAREAAILRRQTSSILIADPKTVDVFNVSDYGNYVDPGKVSQESVAIVEFTNVITYEDQECGPAGMLTKANILEKCFANDNIKGVVMLLDTPGGSGSGMFHIMETLGRSNKPVVAFVRRMAASAGCGIASSANHIMLANGLSSVGSIGAFTTIIDYSGYFENMGLSVTDIYATKSTKKNESYREAMNGNTKPLLAELDTFNEMFISSIKTNRTGKYSDDPDLFSGKMYMGQAAIDCGLADSFGTLSDAVAKVVELANSNF